MSDCLPPPVVCKTLPKLAEIAVVCFWRPFLAPHSSPFFLVVQQMGAHLGSELVREWRESTSYLDDWNLHRKKAMCRVRGGEQMMRWVPKIGEVYSRILRTNIYNDFMQKLGHDTSYYLAGKYFTVTGEEGGAQGSLSAGNFISPPNSNLQDSDIWQIPMNLLLPCSLEWLYSPRLFFFEGFFGSKKMFRP